MESIKNLEKFIKFLVGKHEKHTVIKTINFFIKEGVKDDFFQLVDEEGLIRFNLDLNEIKNSNCPYAYHKKVMRMIILLF